MLKVFVSMGKQMPRDKVVVEDAENVAKLLAKYGCTMVQTGAKLGLMGIAVEEFEKYSDELVMITPEQFKSDLEKHTCKQHVVVELESDRMKEAIKNFDLAIILPGGMGTFAELAYFNEVCKSGESNAKIVVVNSKGYYNKLLKFFKHQMKVGFINEDSLKFQVVKTSQAVEGVLQKMIADRHNEIYQASLAMEKLKAKQEAHAKAELDEQPILEKSSTKKSTEKSSGNTKSSAKSKTANASKSSAGRRESADNGDISNSGGNKKSSAKSSTKVKSSTTAKAGTKANGKTVVTSVSKVANKNSVKSSTKAIKETTTEATPAKKRGRPAKTTAKTATAEQGSKKTAKSSTKKSPAKSKK